MIGMIGGGYRSSRQRFSRDQVTPRVFLQMASLRVDTNLGSAEHVFAIDGSHFCPPWSHRGTLPKLAAGLWIVLYFVFRGHSGLPNRPNWCLDTAVRLGHIPPVWSHGPRVRHRRTVAIGHLTVTVRSHGVSCEQVGSAA